MRHDLINQTIRRSGRIPLSTRLVITPAQTQGAFRAESQTIDVSYHGARIFTNADLGTDMEIRVFQPWRNRFQIARVIWAHNTKYREYGIELESDEDFWGIQFPPDRWHELDPENRPISRFSEPEPAVNQATPVSADTCVTTPAAQIEAAKVPPASQPLPASVSKPASLEGIDGSSTLEIPASGLEIGVSGITMAGLPFRETGVFFPADADDRMANVWLHTVMRDGARLRLTFPNSFVMTVRIRATFTTHNAEGKKNKESIALVELPTGVRISVNDDDWS